MRALLSVSDKAGLLEFAQGLHRLGVEIVSTGGTAATLAQAGLPVIGLEEITGFPECLDGRVKTLHPKIHAGILAMRANPEHMRTISELGVTPVDLVVVNLYPFKQTIQKPDCTLELAIENIDIGGPSMLRAAAKNWQDVAVVVDPSDYAVVLREMEEGGVSRDTKFRLCSKVFSHTAAYDALVAQYLCGVRGDDYPEQLTLTFDKAQDMRYGENPHQTAAFYADALPTPGTLPQAEQLNGKELSYNNINDADGALALLREFDQPAVVAVKHGNPCGVGVGRGVFDCYMAAYNADPVSIFGGIVVTNREVDEQTATEMAKTFLEIIIAPSFTAPALEVLRQKKNLRVLALPELDRPAAPGAMECKKVTGGLLVQSVNAESFHEAELKVVTQRQPTPAELADALLAWRIVKHVKSNGIAVARDGHSLGIGPGQVNRVWATQQALERSGKDVRGAALASDAYFPFADSVEAAGKAGISCIIQPGGSIRDEESIAKANEYGMAMIFTGLRHFKH